MKTWRIPAFSLLLPGLLAGCMEVSAPQSSGVDQMARLNAMGYRTTARSTDGHSFMLRYNGAINASVACGSPPKTLSPRMATSGGGVEEFRLNSYLLLSTGADGTRRPYVRDGVYAVTRIARASAGAREAEVETITFGPRGSGKFSSGLSCQPN